MEPSESRGVSSFTCPACAGTWISGDSLHKLFAIEQNAQDLEQKFEALFDLDFAEGKRQCPHCVNCKLKAVNIEGTEIDFCPQCKGLFFDEGELEKVYSTDNAISVKNIAKIHISASEAIWSALTGLFGGKR